MSNKVNIHLLAKAYCDVLTKNTGIEHVYRIKKDDGKGDNNAVHNTTRTSNIEFN